MEKGVLDITRTLFTYSSKGSSVADEGEDGVGEQISDNDSCVQEKNPSEFLDYSSRGVESSSTDSLDYWRRNKDKYPTLSRVARDYLAIPMSMALSDHYLDRARVACAGDSNSFKLLRLHTLLST